MAILPSRIEIQDLKEVMNREIALYETIQELLAQKKQVIIGGDLDALVAIDTDLEKQTQRVAELERERIGLLVKMGGQKQTLKTFIESLQSGEDAQILSEVRDKMLHATQDIKALSQSNTDLLTQSIRFIEQSVEVLASLLMPEGASYTNQSVKKSPFSTPQPGISQLTASTIIRDA